MDTSYELGAVIAQEELPLLCTGAHVPITVRLQLSWELLPGYHLHLELLQNNGSGKEFCQSKERQEAQILTHYTLNH